MANKKVTITISDDALLKLEDQAKALDITVNTYIKQIAMNYITNNKIEFVTNEQKLILQSFQSSQSKIINLLNKITKEYLSQGTSFPADKVLKYFQSYHTEFKKCIQRLSHDN